MVTGNATAYRGRSFTDEDLRGSFADEDLRGSFADENWRVKLRGRRFVVEDLRTRIVDENLRSKICGRRFAATNIRDDDILPIRRFMGEKMLTSKCTTKKRWTNI